MYDHGKVWDAVAGEYIVVGNNAQEAVSRDAAAAVRDKRPQQYFLNKEQAEAAAADAEPAARNDNAEGAG